MASKQHLAAKALSKMEEEEGVASITGILDAVTAFLAPAPLPTIEELYPTPIGDNIPESLDAFFKSSKSAIIHVLEQMASANRDAKDILYPFLLCYAKLPRNVRLQGKFSLDELLSLLNDNLPVEKRIPIGEVRRRIVYNLDLMTQDASLVKLHAYKPKVLETSIKVALDPSDENSFKERDALLKTVGLRLPDKSQSPSIVVNNNQQNITSIKGLPRFADTLNMTYNQPIDVSEAKETLLMPAPLDIDTNISNDDLSEENRLMELFNTSKFMQASRQDDFIDADEDDEDADYEDDISSNDEDIDNNNLIN